MTSRFSPGRVAALLRKELSALFGQPLLWVVGTFFLLLAGYYFYTDLVFFVTFGFGENIFENFFQLLFVDLRLVLLLTVPLLTMRAFAEERKLGTTELLFTWPLRDGEIVLAKFLACAIAAGALLAATIVPLAWLHGLQPFSPWPVVAAYLGLALMAASFVAIGLLLSSLTDNQVVAAMSTLGVLLLLWLLSWNESSAENGVLSWLPRLSMFDHFEGFARGVVESRDVVYFACLVTFGAAACLQVLGARSWRGSRLLPTLLGLAGLLVSLGFVGAFGERWNARLDLTPGRTRTLSAHTRRILDRLDSDVEVIAFVRSADPANAWTTDLVGRFAEASPRVRVRTADVNRNPAMARRYGVDAYGAVVVAKGDRRRVFRHASEETIAGAIQDLGRSRPVSVAVVGDGAPVGGRPAGGRAFSALATALSDQGDDVRVVPVGGGPGDADVAIVLGGEGDWPIERIAAFEDWLARGGRLLALVEPGAAPELGAWLARRGVDPRAGAVVDPEDRLHGGEGVSLRARPPASETEGASEARADDGAAGISAALGQGVLLSLARPLVPDRDATTLLASGEQSWSTSDLDRAQRGLAEFDPSVDARGPFPVAAARSFPGSSGAPGARLVVVGDADFASDGFVDFLDDRDFLLNAVAWLSGDDDLVALRGRRKEIGREQFFLSASQARTALLLAAGVLPAASAAIAIAIALRSRFAR
ncbi:MAG: Gldg family protein [Alphaproteobacteria bacterium]